MKKLLKYLTIIYQCNFKLSFASESINSTTELPQIYLFYEKCDRVNPLELKIYVVILQMKVNWRHMYQNTNKQVS